MISPGIIFDNTSNYSIVKTETVIGFGQKQDSLMNIKSTVPFEWLISHEDFARSLPETNTEQLNQRRSKFKKPLAKGHHKKKHSKIKKCIYKLLKKKKKKGKHLHIMMKKYMIPLIIGLIAAKSILIPVAFKTLAFMSVKGYAYGCLFSTIMMYMLNFKTKIKLSRTSKLRREYKI